MENPLMKKCVFVFGPESSGSKLIAKICSHVLDIDRYGDWNGGSWSDHGLHKVYHRSLPYGIPPRFPDIIKLIAENEKDYDLYFILTTRDISISEISRFKRFSKPHDQLQLESAKAREIITDLLKSDQKCFIWSYETLMFLQQAYLNQLYHFLRVSTDFSPKLVDGNVGKINFNK
jgi:hypothetical protein